MAQLVAPFNNSMRLGQGFNSYTHQIRLHNAVTVAPHGYTGTPSSSDSDPAWMHADERDQRYDEDDDSEEKSQIVTYSTRFVDKISEVVDSMNISAALSINTNMIGGSANGTYIDSDKFKQSDVNYVVQVRVTNQRSDMRPRSKLNLVTSVKAASSQADGNVLLVHDGGDIGSIDLTKFRDVYGDTFISGWEEGGELNALISVKTKNKAKLNKIKGAIEARLGTPALSGKVSGSIDMEKSDTFSESETTITVNWSGGGKIKDYDILWDINSLTLAAANFPDNVMRTPQRTYAILSRYEELPDFQNKIPNYSALDYDLASVYTYALLDMYTDYKAIWKTLQISSSDAELGRIRFEQARINQETMDYLGTYKPKLLTSSTDAPTGGSKAADASSADVKVADAKVADAKVGDTKVADTKGNAVTPEPTILERSLGLKSENGRVQPYKPSFLGLQSAKSAVRYQMLRIVGTVDDLKKNPRLVLNPDVGDILAPSVFRQLLPVAIPVPVNPNDDWIEPLGTSFSPEQNLTHANFEQFPQAKASALMNSEKAKHFRMSKWAGPAKPGQSPRFVFTNDLDRLSNGLLINSIRVYHEKLGITGLAIGYTNGTIAKHGNLKSNDHKEYPVRGRSVLSIQMARSVSQQATDSTPEESGLVLFMLCFSNLETSQIKTGDYRPSAQDFTFSTAPDDHDGKPWNLAGFYSNFDTKTNRIESLGAIWTNDKEALSMPLLPLGMALEEFPPVLQDKIRESLDKSDKFRMSEWVGNLSYDRGPSSGFDLVKIEEERPFVKKVQFFYGQWGSAGIEALCGVQVTWFHVKDTKAVQTLSIGNCSGTNSTTWDAGGAEGFTHQIIGIEVTVACATQGEQVFVGAIKLKITRPWDAVEKTRTVYVDSKPATVSDKVRVVDKKWLSWPLDAGKWSIRGFYGQWGDVIDRMGVIWGRDREKYGVEVKATEVKAT